ncbi:histidine phosphatase family protein [Aquibacillus sediminis]|uniref:histidine phosphatase family protein n=1 Tax=Aquibacillus sediminis TaxID=2574734 RepID=UPI001FE9A8F7|nr:histidine phosphatase family protein [Aquibacillus sediminis]
MYTGRNEQDSLIHVGNRQLNALSLNEMVESLSVGGFILYARHAEATVGRDQPNLHLQDCSTQRNLSDTGRRQAITYGQVLRDLRIPVVYPVLSSPFCRNVETAALAFGSDYVQIDPLWVQVYNLSTNLNQMQQNQLLNQLQTKFESIPQQGTNQVIIGHSFPANIGLGPISNMGTVVIQPHGQGYGFEIVARLSLEQLTQLSDGK